MKTTIAIILLSTLCLYVAADKERSSTIRGLRHHTSHSAKTSKSKKSGGSKSRERNYYDEEMCYGSCIDILITAPAEPMTNVMEMLIGTTMQGGCETYCESDYKVCMDTCDPQDPDEWTTCDQLCVEATGDDNNNGRKLGGVENDFTRFFDCVRRGECSF